MRQERPTRFTDYVAGEIPFAAQNVSLHHFVGATGNVVHLTRDRLAHNTDTTLSVPHYRST